jgi:hypothetical protein
VQPAKFWGVCFWGLALAAAGFFAAAEVQQASSKAMWADETNALTLSVRAPTLGSLVLKGAPAQGSPSPLDYILLKGLDNFRAEAGYFGLPPLAYFRLAALMATLLAGFAVLFLSWRYFRKQGRLSVAHGILILGALLTYWFRFLGYYYTAEMRPYALWLGLYFIATVSFFNWPRWRILSAGTLLLLALTATAAVFQLFALFLAFVIVRLMERRAVAETLRNGLGLFLIPVLISVYYGYRAGVWDYNEDQWGTWGTFLTFWRRKEHVFLASCAAVALCAARRPTWRFAIPSLSMLLLYLLAPLIFYVTRLRGVFFTDRHYIYYELAVPLLFLSGAFCLSEYLSNRKVRQFGLPAILLVSLVLVAAFSRTSFSVAKRELARADYGGVPKDPARIYAELVQKELPKGFCFQDAGISDPPVENIRIVAAWLSERYKAIPVGGRSVYLARDGNNARVLSVDSASCTGRMIPVARAADRR